MPFKPCVLILQADQTIATRMADLVLAGNPDANVGIVDSPRRALEALDQYEDLHLVLFELYFSEGNGLQFLAAVRGRFRSAQLIVVTKYNLKNFSEHTQGLTIFPLPLDESVFYATCQDALFTLEGMEFPPFRLGKKLRPDRWGDCYEAFDTGVKREVYITIRHAWATIEQSVLFRSSAALMARASHPYVESVYQAGEAEGRDFFAREKWEGTNLAELATAGKLIAPRQAAQILQHAASVILFWQNNKLSHMPIGALEVSISNQGLVKFANCVTPTQQLQLEEPGMSSFMELEAALRKVLPALDLIPFSLRKLLLKLSEGPVLLTDVIKEAQAIDVELAPVTTLAKSSETKEAERILAQEKWKQKLWGYGIIGAAILAALLILAILFQSFLFSGEKDFSNLQAEIPAGPFTFQDGTATLDKPVLMDKYEVTWGEYNKFLLAIRQEGSDQAYADPSQPTPNKDHEPSDYAEIYESLKNGTTYKGAVVTLNSPVFNVDWYDAQAFARWAHKRLPTEQEWEKAARGPENLPFPWGQTFSLFANMSIALPDQAPVRHHVQDVDKNPQDVSGYGVYDLAGNVSEWTSTITDSTKIPGLKVVVIRGGNYLSRDEQDAQTNKRNLDLTQEIRESWLGFRCVQDKE